MMLILIFLISKLFTKHSHQVDEINDLKGTNNR